MNDWTVREADLTQEAQAKDFIRLLEAYARDPEVGDGALPADVKQRLLEDIPNMPQMLVLLAYDGTRAIGLANCLRGYSTFAARPLLNLHDIVVDAQYRRRGVARALLHATEDKARALGCCKLTLEVLEGNEAARQVYRRFGFVPYELNPNTGPAQFWHKTLS